MRNSFLEPVSFRYSMKPTDRNWLLYAASQAFFDPGRPVHQGYLNRLRFWVKNIKWAGDEYYAVSDNLVLRTCAVVVRQMSRRTPPYRQLDSLIL